MSRSVTLRAAHSLCASALLQALRTAGAMPLHKATITPRGNSLGMVTQLPDKDETSVSLRQMRARLDVCMGGRVAEEVRRNSCPLAAHVAARLLLLALARPSERKGCWISGRVS